MRWLAVCITDTTVPTVCIYYPKPTRQDDLERRETMGLFPGTDIDLYMAGPPSVSSRVACRSPASADRRECRECTQYHLRRANAPHASSPSPDLYLDQPRCGPKTSPAAVSVSGQVDAQGHDDPSRALGRSRWS